MTATGVARNRSPIRRIATQIIALTRRMLHDRDMTSERLPAARAMGVHLLTATGVLFAMLALISAVDAKWGMMFFWLIVAFVVDGVDGPLARKFDVKTYAPQLDGVLLDLIVDYLTYVFIPAYALFNSGLLEGWLAWAVALAICFTSVVYFADTRMKTEDASFSGFPGCWNMAVIVIFAVDPPQWAIALIVAVLAPLMFTTLRFVHPVRTQAWRAVTLPIAIVWSVTAGWAALSDFEASGWPVWLLVAASIWLLVAGALQQVLGVGKSGTSR